MFQAQVSAGDTKSNKTESLSLKSSPQIGFSPEAQFVQSQKCLQSKSHELLPKMQISKQIKKNLYYITVIRYQDLKKKKKALRCHSPNKYPGQPCESLPSTWPKRSTVESKRLHSAKKSNTQKRERKKELHRGINNYFHGDSNLN